MKFGLTSLLISLVCLLIPGDMTYPSWLGYIVPFDERALSKSMAPGFLVIAFISIAATSVFYGCLVLLKGDGFEHINSASFSIANTAGCILILLLMVLAFYVFMPKLACVQCKTAARLQVMFLLFSFGGSFVIMMAFVRCLFVSILKRAA